MDRLTIAEEKRAAFAAGKHTFVSANPCKTNPLHVHRFTSNGQCVDCVTINRNTETNRAYARAYAKEYRKDHPDKVKTAVTRWHRANPDKMAAIRLRYCLKKDPGYIHRDDWLTLRKLRLAAKARGDKTFKSGKPCVNGHFAERSTVSGHCLECRRIARQELATKKTMTEAPNRQP